MASNTCFNLINPLAWFVQEQQCTNHAKPSLRSGADLKVKLMLDAPFGENMYSTLVFVQNGGYYEYS